MEEQTKTCEGQTQKKEESITEAKGETLVFIVYRKDCDQRIRNAVILFSGRIKSYGGRIFGISTDVKVAGPEDSQWCKYNDWCIVALGFPSQEKARFWFVSEPHVKQHDFPPPSDNCMVFSVPIRYIPKPGKLTFCWTEMSNIKDKGSYQVNFVDKVTDLFDTKGISHGVVYIKDKEQSQLHRLKDCWIQQNAHYRLDLYSSQTEFQQIYDSDPYKTLNDTQDCLSETTSVLFTLDPKIA